MVSDETKNTEKPHAVGVQVEPIERSRYRGRKTHHSD